MLVDSADELSVDATTVEVLVDSADELSVDAVTVEVLVDRALESVAGAEDEVDEVSSELLDGAPDVEVVVVVVSEATEESDTVVGTTANVVTEVALRSCRI